MKNSIKTRTVPVLLLSFLLLTACYLHAAVSFSSSTIASVGDAGYFTRIVVDKDGGRHAIYATSLDTVRYSSAPANGSWGPFATVFDGYCTSWISVAIDTTTVPNKLHLSAYNSTLGDLVYSSATVGASSIIWSSSTVNSTNDVGGYSSIALDQLGNPHIAYRDKTIAVLKYSSYSVTSGWQSYTVDDSPPNDSGLFTSIKIGQDGLRHIVYGSWNGADYDLKISTKMAVGWSTSTIVSAGSVGRYCSLAIDSVGDLHVSYKDETTGNLKYIKRISGAWQSEIIVDNSIGNGALWNSIGIDALGSMHIAYYDSLNTDLKHAQYEGTWSTQTVWGSGSNVGEYASLYLQNFTSSGTVNIACYNSTLGDAIAFKSVPAVVQSVAPGNWSVPGTWEGNAVPLPGQGVQIQSGHTVTFDRNDTNVTCSTLTILGTLKFEGAVSSRTLIVAGNVDIQSSGQFLMPPNTGYVSALKIKCDTAGQYGIIVNDGGKFDVQGSSFTGLTRNCLITSDNPSYKTYIRNYSTTEANFNMYYVEVSSMGVAVAGKDGITFESGTRGKINFCSIHNGFLGIYLYSSSNNTISNNNCYSNNTGIFLFSSSNNTFSNNNCYSNSTNGILLNTSSNNNTLSNNNCYSNSNNGIYLDNSSNNTISNNSCYSNFLNGIYLNGSSNNNTLSNNSCYLNPYGIYTSNNSINNTVVNCELGKSGNNTNGDIGYSAGSVSKLTLKNCNLYSTTKVNTAGMDTAGSYLVSYNQDGTSGTTKIWGDYNIPNGSTGTFNYAEPLYVSTATLPNSTLKGTGTILYPTTDDSKTQTEFWEVKYNGTNFDVRRGTWSVLTFDGTATVGSPYSSAARGVGFTANGTFQTDDAFYFVTISSSNDQNVQKRIEFNDTPIGTRMFVEPVAAVQMVGNQAFPTISTNAVGSTYYGFQSSGTLNLSNYFLSNLKSPGLEIYPQATVVDLSSGTFNTIQGSGDSSYIRASGLTSAATFYGCVFNDTPGTMNYNVKADGAGINWTFNNWSGVKGGEDYDYDGVGSTITWQDTTLPPAPTNLNVSLLGTTSIQWQFTDNSTTETGLYISSGTSITMRLSPNLGNGSYTGTTSWVETTLLPNTSYQRYAEAVNVVGSSWSVSITSYTLANKSSGTYISNVTSNSITVNWYANGNPGGTYYDVEYSTADNFVPYGEIYGTTSLIADCTGLLSNTTYYFRTNARNFQSINTGFDTVVSTKTLPSSGGGSNGIFSGDFSSVGGSVYDGTSYDSGYNIAVDTFSAGGPYIYVIGSSSNGASGLDYFTVKYNASGVMLASATFNSIANKDDNATDIAVDGSGNVFVTGYCSNGTNEDYITIKYDSSLAVLSSATYNGGNADFAYGIAIDNVGNVFVTGRAYNGSNGDYFTIKYNNNLVVQTSVTYNGGSNDTAFGVAVDTAGYVFVTGYAYGTNENYFTIKYNNNLVVQASATYNGGNVDIAYHVAVDNTGNVFVTGRSYAVADDCFTIKYNNNLVVQTSVTYNGGFTDVGTNIAVELPGSGNNVYVSGYSNNGTNTDYFIMKYNNNMVFQSSSVFNGGYDDWAYGVAVGVSSFVYVTGTSNNGTNTDYRTIRYALPDASDITLPTSKITFPSVSPVNTLATISGTSADNNIISGVSIKIKRMTDDKYWDGAGFNSVAENWRFATASDGGFNSGNENWSLTESLDSYLTSGTSYWLVSRASDTAGNLETPGSGFTVMYDSAPPTVTNNQPGDDVVRKISGTVYNVDFNDAGNLDTVQYRVTTLPSISGGGTEVIPWTNIATNIGAISYTTDWQVNFALLLSLPTTNWVSVRCWDIAGNTTTVNDVFYVMKDTVPPTSSIISPSNDSNVQTLTYISGVVSDNYGIDKVELQIKRFSDNFYWSGSNWQAGAVWVQTSNNTWQYYGLTDSNLTVGESYWVVSRASDTFGNVEVPVSSNTFTYKTKKTISSGNWTNAATWFGGQMPLAGDAVILKSPWTVTLTANTSSLYSLTIEDSAKLDSPTPYTVNISSGSGGGLYNYGTLANIGGTCYIGGNSGNKIYLSTDNAKCFNSMFVNAGSTVTLQSNLDIGYIDIASAGTLDANSRQIILSGGWQQNGTFLAGVSTVTFTGTNNQDILGTVPKFGFTNFAVNSSSTVAPQKPLDINGNFTISGGTFVAGNFEHTIAGNLKQTGGGFSAQTSTITFDGTGAQTVSVLPGNLFKHFQYLGTGSLTPQSNLDISGNFTEGNGTFYCGNYTYRLTGLMSISVGWDSGNSTWILDGTTPQNIQSGVGFANVIIKNPAGVKYNPDIMGQIQKNLSIDAGCSLDASEISYLQIWGNFTSSGTFVKGGSTTSFVSGNSTIWTVANSTFNNVSIAKSASSDIVYALTNLDIGGWLEISTGTMSMAYSTSTVKGVTNVSGPNAVLDLGSSTTTITGQLSVTTGGTLLLPAAIPKPVLKLGNGIHTVDSGGFFVSQSSNNLITSTNPGTVFYTLKCFASTVNVTGVSLQSAGYDIDSMLISNDAKIVNLDNVVYKDPLAATSRGLTLGYLTIPGTYTFTGHNFESMVSTNVYAPFLVSGIVVMQNSIGAKAGPSYEVDPNDRVFWLGYDSMTVTQPAGGETFVVGASTAIKWTTYGSVKNVKLEYTTNDFASVNFIANVSTSVNFGSYNWVIPNDVSPTVKVRVSALNYSTINTVSAAFTIQQPVAAPSNLKVGLIGTTSIQWTFTDNASDETGLYISSGTDVSMRLSENLGPTTGTTSWWNINLSTNTQYARYAEAVNAVGSSWSAMISSYTLSSAPYWTKIISRSSYTVELDWQPNGNPEPGTQYIVSHSTLSDFSSEINGTASTSTYIVSSLNSATLYYFKVRSRNGDLVINQQYDAFLTTTTLDGVAPSVSITQPANGSYKNYASIFSVFYGPLSDNVAVSSAVISMRISGGNYTSGPAFDSVSPVWFDCAVFQSSWTYQPTPSDILTSGTMYVMEVKAVDSSGNWSSVATSSCTYDNTMPVSAVVSPANNSVINSLATLSGTSADNTGVQGVELRIQRFSDGAYWTGASWSTATWLPASGTNVWSYTGLTTANLTSGASYWVVSRATDFAVNTSTLTAGSVIFTYQAPVAGIFSGDFSQPGGAVYNSTGDDGAQGVAVDTITVGGPYIFVVGTSSSGVTGYDYFTVKYNASGVMLSSATFNRGSDDDGTGIAVDNSGNVYVTGESNNGSTVDYVTIKYNNNLVFQSSAVINSGNVDGGVGIAVDKNGFVYITGESYNGTNYDYATVKYTSGMVYQSSAVFNSGLDDYGSGIATDNSGNVYITGGSYNGANFDYVTIKYNNSLVFQSSAVYNSGGNDESRGIGIDNSGNVYVTGVSLIGSTTNYVTLKYNNSLVFQSSAVFSGFVEVGSGVAIDNSGNVYIAGSSNNGSNTDYLAIKYSSNLVFQSSAVFNSGYWDEGRGIAVDNSGYVYVTGYSDNGTNSDIRTLRLTLPDLPSVTKPAAPTLTATEVTNSSIKWDWTDVSNEQGYYLRTSTGGFLSSLTANTVNYSETGLTPNTQYSRYVEAYNAGGINTSTVVSKYTLAALPSSFVVSAKDYNFVSLSWSANSNPSNTIYELYRSTDSSTFLPLYLSTSTSYTDTGLSQLTTYYYQLYSVNAESIKTGPVTVTVQTLNSVIKGPVSGKVTQSDGTAILGVLVQLYNNEGTVKLGETTTKSDGTYLFENLDDGIYRVVCSWLVNEIESVVYKTDIPENSKDVLFTLEIQYQLAQLAGKIALGSRANFVSGKFAPAQQPYVELLQRGRVIAKIDADTSGNYEIPNLLPGKYVVRAFNGVQMSEPTEIKVAEGEKLNINFKWALGLVNDEVYAFPNPCKTSALTIRYKANTNHTATLRIYNIAGELVREIKGDGSEFGVSSVKKIPWDLKNDDDSEIASGVYIYILELKETADDGEKATVKKKLAVIK